jgi:tRNA-2-methylthio-N6-dimethylallyladenosine synthase
MEEVGFDWAFMFAYSERPGTLAARQYPDDVPPEVKNRRLNEIIALQGRKSLERYRAQIGKTLEVLVEGPSKRDPGQLCGRASNNMMCVFPAAGRRAGTYATVKVVDCTSATLICE